MVSPGQAPPPFQPASQRQRQRRSVAGPVVLILLGMVVIHYVCGRVAIRARIVGKIATVLQMTAVSWALLKWPASALHFWSLAAAICTALSGLLYVFDGVRQLSQSPASLPKPDQSKH